MTILLEPDEDGWIIADIPEVHGVHSQGRTREEARKNVISALHDVLELRFGDGASVVSGGDGDSLQLLIAT